MEETRKYGIVKLTNDNYHIWSQRTELWLRKEDIWDVIEEATPTTPDANWSKRDRQARATIGLLIEDKFLPDIKHETSAKNAWYKLKQTHSHNSLGSRLLLYRQIFSTRYTPGSSMIEHITGILGAASKLEDAGYKMLDELVCSALLGSLPSEYDVLITTIEGRNDKEITTDFVREKILEEHKKDKGHTTPHQETRALFASSSSNYTKHRKIIKCYYCKKVGHIRKDCRILKNHNAHDEYTGKPTQGKQSHAKMMQCSNDPAEPDPPLPIGDDACFDTSIYRALNIATNRQSNHKGSWIIDTGAEDHMCNDLHKLHNVIHLTSPITVVTASGERHLVHTKGDHTLELEDELKQKHELTLSQVLYVPELLDDLLSIARLDDDGYLIKFNNKKCWLESGDTAMNLGTLVNKLYIHNPKEKPIKERANICGHVWHARLGHRNQPDISRMMKEDMVEDMKVEECSSSGLCSACVISKMANTPFRTIDHPRSHRPFQFIHSDLCGPITPHSLGHNAYILTMTDDYTKYSCIYMLKSKDQTREKIIEYIEMGINKFGYRPEVFLVMAVVSTTMDNWTPTYVKMGSSIGTHFRTHPRKTAGQRDLTELLWKPQEPS